MWLPNERTTQRDVIGNAVFDELLGDGVGANPTDENQRHADGRFEPAGRCPVVDLMVFRGQSAPPDRLELAGGVMLPPLISMPSIPAVSSIAAIWSISSTIRPPSIKSSEFSLISTGNVFPMRL